MNKTPKLVEADDRLVIAKGAWGCRAGETGQEASCIGDGWELDVWW